MKCQKQPLLMMPAAVSMAKPDVTTAKESGAGEFEPSCDFL
jgi:hypothetical protein